MFYYTVIIIITYVLRCSLGGWCRVWDEPAQTSCMHDFTDVASVHCYLKMQIFVDQYHKGSFD